MNFEPLIDFLESYLPMLGIPGSDILIHRDRKEVFRHQSGFGDLEKRTPVDPNALYNLYSCTKVATCVAATQLIERGEILATDPVYAYFPEYRNLKIRVKDHNGTETVKRANNVLTIEHLLTMTGGLDYNLNRPAIKRVIKETGGRAPTLDVIRALPEDPFVFEPGAKYEYSLCLDVMGGIIELVTGVSLGEYMKNNIFLPLGMNDTAFDITDAVKSRLAPQYNFDPETGETSKVSADSNAFRFGTEYQSGGAGLISSVHDQMLLADALTHFGVGNNGNRILSKFGVQLMSANHLKPDILPSFTIPHCAGYSYGYGVRVNIDPEAVGNLSPRGEFGWDGMRGSYMSVDPVNKVSVFYAEHRGGMHPLVIPRLRNIIYSCLGE